MKVASFIPKRTVWLHNALMILKGAAIAVGVVCLVALTIMLLAECTHLWPMGTFIAFIIVMLLGVGALIALNCDWLIL